MRRIVIVSVTQGLKLAGLGLHGPAPVNGGESGVLLEPEPERAALNPLLLLQYYADPNRRRQHLGSNFCGCR